MEIVMALDVSLGQAPTPTNPTNRNEATSRGSLTFLRLIVFANGITKSSISVAAIWNDCNSQNTTENSAPSRIVVVFIELAWRNLSTVDAALQLALKIVRVTQTMVISIAVSKRAMSISFAMRAR